VFALQKPIAFLPERVRTDIPKKLTRNGDTPSGEVVKKMYEDIISLPNTMSPDDMERTRSSKGKRKQLAQASYNVIEGVITVIVIKVLLTRLSV